ncbi:MAG: hypothetical protein EOO38_22780, partial [Cytophagaceae bacterium]
MKFQLPVLLLVGLSSVRAQAQNVHQSLPTLPASTTALALVSDAPTATTPPASYSDAQGLKITPLEAEPNDLADILGVKMWHFKVEVPKPGLRLHYTLEVRQQGENGQFNSVLDQLNSTTTDPIDIGNPAQKNAASSVPLLVGFYKDKEEEIWNSFVRVANGNTRGTTGALSGFKVAALNPLAQHLEGGNFELARYG